MATYLDIHDVPGVKTGDVIGAPTDRQLGIDSARSAPVLRLHGGTR